jgi:hypothetical protein
MGDDSDNINKQLLYLLSRADTLHDFVGARSVLSKAEVISILNNSKELQEEAFKDLKSLYTLDKRNLDGILNKNESSPLVNLNFPKTYTPKNLKRIAGITSYEPKTVLFYEMNENLLKDVKIGRFISNDQLVEYSYVGNKYVNGTRKTFSSANIAYLNLGTTEKKNTNRKASGIYGINQDKRYAMLQEQINLFYNADAYNNIYLIVDTCGVKLADLGINETTKIKILCNVAGDWDGATKTSCTSKNTLCIGIKENKDNPLERSVFELQNLELNKDASSSTVSITKTIENTINTANATVEVAPLSKCIKDKNTCYNFLDNIDLFDIKRTGDALQVLITKKAQKAQQEANEQNIFCTSNGSTNDKFIFVTLDHLAFLKARLNGIPSIFTSKDMITEEKLMILYKPEVDYNDLAKQFFNTYDKFKELKNKVENVKLDNILDNIAYTSGHSIISYYLNENKNLINLISHGNESYQNKEKTIKILNDFYRTLLANSTDFDKILNPNKEIGNAISTLLTNANTLYTNFPDILKPTKHYKNIEKLISWLPTTIYRTINMILYIEIMACICDMYNIFTYKDGKWQFNQLDNINTILGDVNKFLKENEIHCENINHIKSNIDVSLLQALISDEKKQKEFNNHLSEMRKYISKYETFDFSNFINYKISDYIDDYNIIFKSITNIINRGLYGKKLTESKSLIDTILSIDGKNREKTLSVRQINYIALEASNRFVLSIMNQILDTLISFARVKINSIDIQGKSDDLNVFITDLKEKINKLRLQKGGQGEDPKEDQEDQEDQELKNKVEEVIKNHNYNLQDLQEDLQQDFTLDVNDDPYDYGNLIDKFKKDILVKLSTLEKSSTLEDIEYYVHYYLEEVINEKGYLYTGLAAFWADTTVASNYNKWEWDDYVCFLMILYPIWLYDLNIAFLTNDQTSLPCIKEYATAPLVQNHISSDCALVRSLSIHSISPEEQQPFKKQRAGGFKRFTMSDYYFKYYKPYYNLYYKN